MSKIKALWKLIKVVGKYGAKVLKYLKSAFDVIWKYGTKAVNWVINNIGKIVSYISAAVSIKDFIEWIKDILESIF